MTDTANGHPLGAASPAEQATELICVGGPLHGSLRPRGQLLAFDITMAPQPGAPNPRFLAEPHTYQLTTFHYSADTQVQYWRHKPLDSGRAGNFILLDFLVNRPSLKAAAAFACLRAIHAAASGQPMLNSRDVLAAIERIIKPRQQPQNEDPQP